MKKSQLILPRVFSLEEQIESELLAWTCTAPLTHSAAVGQRREKGGRGEKRAGEKWKGEEEWGTFFFFWTNNCLALPSVTMRTSWVAGTAGYWGFLCPKENYV